MSIYYDLLKKHEKDIRKQYGDMRYDLMTKHFADEGKQVDIAPRTSRKNVPSSRPKSTYGVGENMFYTNEVNYGIMVNKQNNQLGTIKDYNKAIADADKNIYDLNKAQYGYMMNGEQDNMNAMDPIIEDAERKLGDLQAGLGSMMGIASARMPKLDNEKNSSTKPQDLLKGVSGMANAGARVASVSGRARVGGKISLPRKDAIQPTSTPVGTGILGLNDNERAASTEYSSEQQEYIDTLMQNIQNYWRDKTYIVDSEEFNSLYPVGVFNQWTNELSSLVGKDVCEMVVGGASSGYKYDRQDYLEVVDVLKDIGTVVEYDPNTHTYEANSIFDSNNDRGSDVGDKDKVELYSRGNTVSDLTKNIKNYWAVKPYILDGKEFEKLYPAKLYNQWTNDLAGLIDEKEFDDFMDNALSDYDEDRLQFEETIKYTDDGYFEFNLDTLTLEFKPDPLKDIDTEKLGFVNPKADNCYTYQDYKGKYCFGDSFKPQNAALHAYGFVPFGSVAVMAIKKGSELLSGVDYIDGGEFGAGLDAVSILKYLNNPLVKIAGQAASWVGKAITAYNFADSIISNEADIIQITNNMFGSRLDSSTREGCLNKFSVYFNITKKAVDEGIITYKSDFGQVESDDIDYDFNKLKELIDSTDIDFDYLQEYYK